MHMTNSMMFLVLFSIFLIVHGQLSVDELFYFNSKYTSIGNCSDFLYTFPNFRINSNNYNQLIFDCNSSNIIFRNQNQISSSFCPEYGNYSNNFLIHFHQSSDTLIQVNQLRLHGIELCSLDDLIRNSYSEYSYYRSQWALLINLETNNKQEQHHLAIATNGEMTFIVFIVPSEYNTILKERSIELIFPNENIFQFNRSSINVWQIDQGYVRRPKSMEDSIIFQLSKLKFTLFNNETFLLYGTQASYSRRFTVLIDETSVICNYNYILQCTFPILPLNIRDEHVPILNIIYNRKSIYNATLTLIPRIRLDQVPTNHTITNRQTFNVSINENLCTNDSLKSWFTLIIHLQIRDINGTERYEKIVNEGMRPVDCNTTAKIGREIANSINPIPLDDIKSINVDLIHQWYEHQNCPAERTRIMFT